MHPISPNKSRSWNRLQRWAKTLFFILTMLASLLLVSASPISVITLDFLLPPFLFTASLQSSSVLVQFKKFSFDSSLIDLPLISLLRSLLILVAYVGSSGQHQWVYLGVTAMCGAGSIGYVLVKIAMATRWVDSSREGLGVEALIFSFIALGIGHVVVAYRTSCRERRKLLVYKIDIEAVKMKGSPIKGDSKL